MHGVEYHEPVSSFVPSFDQLSGSPRTIWPNKDTFKSVPATPSSFDVGVFPGVNDVSRKFYTLATPAIMALGTPLSPERTAR